MDRVGKGGTGRQGRRAESLLVGRVGGTATIGSGNKEGSKGDVVLGDFLMENKTSSGKSLKLELDWLLKIYQEALETGKTPVLSFQFVNEIGKSEKRERWCCIPEHLFSDMVERLEDLEK